MQPVIQKPKFIYSSLLVIENPDLMNQIIILLFYFFTIIKNNNNYNNDIDRDNSIDSLEHLSSKQGCNEMVISIIYITIFPIKKKLLYITISSSL